MPSHLSTGGFLVPMDETARWLVGRLTRWPGLLKPERQAMESRFWEIPLVHTRFTLGAPAREETGASLPPVVRILFEDGPARPQHGLVGLVGLDGDALVVRRTRRALDLSRARPAHPVRLPSAIGTLLAPDRRADVTRPLRSLRFSEPYFGVRTFEFTVDETLDIRALIVTTSTTCGSPSSCPAAA